MSKEKEEDYKGALKDILLADKITIALRDKIASQGCSAKLQPEIVYPLSIQILKILQ